MPKQSLRRRVEATSFLFPTEGKPGNEIGGKAEKQSTCRCFFALVQVSVFVRYHRYSPRFLQKATLAQAKCIGPP